MLCQMRGNDVQLHHDRKASRNIDQQARPPSTSATCAATTIAELYAASQLSTAHVPTADQRVKLLDVREQLSHQSAPTAATQTLQTSTRFAFFSTSLTFAVTRRDLLTLMFTLVYVDFGRPSPDRVKPKLRVDCLDLQTDDACYEFSVKILLGSDKKMTCYFLFIDQAYATHRSRIYELRDERSSNMMIGMPFSS